MKKIFIIIIVFLLIGTYLITTRSNYNLKENKEDRISFLKEFSGWIINLGRNMKELTGMAQKQEWLPQEYNETDSVK